MPHFSAPLPPAFSLTGQPRPYQPGLAPAPSPLQPHCIAVDRLRRWLPVVSRDAVNAKGERVNITDQDLERTLVVLTYAWTPGTRQTYGTGLLIFHVFCDSREIPEEQRCPASTVLMLAFISACTGAYSGAALANYFYAVQAWHTLHGAPWTMTKAEAMTALNGATALAPPKSKQEKRVLFTKEIIKAIHDALDLLIPLDAAVYACLMTTFWSAARLGEFTVPTLRSFEPKLHIKRSNVRQTQDRHGFSVTAFSLPWTKSAPEGEEVYWAVQDGVWDPAAALDNPWLLTIQQTRWPSFPGNTHQERCDR